MTDAEFLEDPLQNHCTKQLRAKLTKEQRLRLRTAARNAGMYQWPPSMDQARLSNFIGRIKSTVAAQMIKRLRS
jgi:hypothetical protein